MVAGLLPDQARGRTVINDHVRDGCEITTLLDASAQPLLAARRAFALATGMQRVSLCVADADVRIALAQGCTLQTELGDGWLSFELWSIPAPPDLRVWLGAAYAHARAGIGPRH